jgi:hypothetical protein
MHVGWDWASQRHDVTVIDDTGRRVDRWTLAPPSRHHQAMTRLAGHGRPEHLPVAIEATSGIVVDRLLAAGHPVVPIHPNSFNAARPRWGASKAKSDPVTASSWPRTCAPMPPAAPPATTDAATRHLQAISRLRTDHLEPRPRPPTSSAPCWRPTGQAQGHLCPSGQRHRAGGPGARSHPAGRPAAGRGPHGRLPGSPRLQRPAHPSPAASPAAGRPGRRRPARSRGPGSTASASRSGC